MKRIVSAFTALFVTAFAMSVFCHASNTNISIKVEPAVFLCGDIYNIVWSTSTAGEGYVEYKHNGKTKRIYDEEAGIVRTDDYIHTVSVPVDELDEAGEYTVTATAIDSRTPYSVVRGKSCSATRSFIGYHGQSQINIWTLSDIHRTPTNNIMTYVKYAVSRLKGGSPDVVMLLGDIANDMQNKTYAEICIFDTAAQLTGGSIPCVYTRGNHETRGEFSGYLLQYLPSDTGEFYFKFNYGPMSSIVLDFGEDKLDNHVEYAGLVDYENYRIQETEWLSQVGSYNGDPTYRIAFCHGPNIKDHFGYNWLDFLSEMGTDLMVSGHFHQISFWDKSTSNCTDFPIMLDGSHINSNAFNASQLILSDGKITAYGVSDTGEDKLSFEISAGTNLKGSSPSSYNYGDIGNSADTADKTIPTAYGASVSQLLKSASPEFGFLTKPTVFDTGDTYTVAWATTVGVNSMGEVHLTYNGKDYRFTDSESGTLRCLANTHAVRIPKKYLDNNSYEVISQHIIRHSPYGSATKKGNLITSGNIRFSGYNNQSSISMLEVSDLNGDNNSVERIRAAASGYDVLILNGNTLKHAGSVTDVINSLLYNSGKLSGGKIPTVFVRGENELFGEYAPYLSWIVRNSTRQFFEAVEYGPVKMLILDSAGLYPDDSTEYNGLVKFDSVREKQKKWLDIQSYGNAQYKVAISHSPSVYNLVGYNYCRQLNTLGTDIALFAHEQKSAYEPVGTHNRNFISIINGKYSADSTVATQIIFSDGNITVNTLSDNGSIKLTKTVSADYNDLNTFSDLNSDRWYTDAVKYASSQMLMKGISPTLFAPNDNLTRAQAITVFARILDVDLESASNSTFRDVPANAWYSKAIGWAQSAGVTNGTDAECFSPSDAITRQQLCTMLYRMYSDRLDATTNCEFYDFSDVSEYARTAVATLSNYGIISGTGNGMFEPDSVVTRAMMAQILYKSEF